MSIDELYLGIKERLNSLNTPVEHYLSIEYVVHQTLINTLTFYWDNKLHLAVLNRLANECLPIISEIKRKNISLFDNITHYGKIHQAIKLDEKKKAQEKEIHYDHETLAKTGELRLFTDEAKTICFKRYLKEINQYETLFLQIKSNKLRKEDTNVEIDTSFGYVDITGAQKILGLSASKIYKSCSNLEIPHYKPAGKLLFKISELEEWIQSGKQ